MAQYMCGPCGWIYDEEHGDPEHGIAPGTKFEDIPDDWKCPECGVGKEDFYLLDFVIQRQPHPSENPSVPPAAAGNAVLSVCARQAVLHRCDTAFSFPSSKCKFSAKNVKNHPPPPPNFRKKV